MPQFTIATKISQTNIILKYAFCVELDVHHRLNILWVIFWLILIHQRILLVQHRSKIKSVNGLIYDFKHYSSKVGILSNPICRIFHIVCYIHHLIILCP